MPSVTLLFGPMLLGVFLNTILYGMLIVQIFTYYQVYKKDAKWIRYFILYILISETVNTACDIYMMFENLVLKFANPEAATSFSMMLAADPITTVAISAPIQIIVAWRIWIISRARWIPILIVLLAMLSTGGGIWLGVTVIQLSGFTLDQKLPRPALVWLVSSTLNDILITVSLCWSLAKGKTGYNRTDDAINRIMRVTVQTGLITAIFATTDVVFFLVWPHTSLNFFWDFALSKLYSNTFLSTLNARREWNRGTLTADSVLFGRRDHMSTGPGAFDTMSSRKSLELSKSGQTASGNEIYDLPAKSQSTDAMESSGRHTLDISPAVEDGMPLDNMKGVDHNFQVRQFLSTKGM